MAAQLSSRNLEENEDYRGLLLKDRFGGLPVNDEHVQRPMHARIPTVRVELEQRISTFGASHHEETLGKAVRNAARRIEYKHHLHAIGVRGSDPCTTTNSSELRVHVHASTQWQGLLT